MSDDLNKVLQFHALHKHVLADQISKLSQSNASCQAFLSAFTEQNRESFDDETLRNLILVEKYLIDMGFLFQFMKKTMI